MVLIPWRTRYISKKSMKVPRKRFVLKCNAKAFLVKASQISSKCKLVDVELRGIDAWD